MKNTTELVVIDIFKFKNSLEGLKMLRTKAIEENSFETAQWIDGKITTIKQLLGESKPIEEYIKEVINKK